MAHTLSPKGWANRIRSPALNLAEIEEIHRAHPLMGAAQSQRGVAIANTQTSRHPQ